MPASLQPRGPTPAATRGSLRSALVSGDSPVHCDSVRAPRAPSGESRIPICVSSMSRLHIIGGGLAGSEAAWQAASLGVSVVIHEMRPVRKTDVHKTDQLAELVCSNSFRGDKLDNA